MKLRLDEYYYIINWNFDDIENYMPEKMQEKLDEFSKSHNDKEIKEYLNKLYSYIEVINPEYNIDEINLEDGFVKYTAIIKIKSKYYSFSYYYSYCENYIEDQVDVNEDLVEVTPKEITTIIYE